VETRHNALHRTPNSNPSLFVR